MVSGDSLVSRMCVAVFGVYKLLYNVSRRSVCIVCVCAFDNTFNFKEPPTPRDIFKHTYTVAPVGCRKCTADTARTYRYVAAKHQRWQMPARSSHSRGGLPACLPACYSTACLYSPEAGGLQAFGSTGLTASP